LQSEGAYWQLAFLCFGAVTVLYGAAAYVVLFVVL
jgi:hypothetical protein